MITIYSKIILLGFFILLSTSSVMANNRVTACTGSTEGQACSYQDTVGSGNTTGGNPGIYVGTCVRDNGFLGTGLFAPENRLICNGTLQRDDNNRVIDPGSDTGRDILNNPGGSANQPPADSQSRTRTGESFTYENPSQFNSIPELIGGIIRAILLILAGIAVVMIVIAGVKYMSSPSSAEVAKAAEGIRNAVLGIIVIAGAYLIVEFVLQAVV